jgi:hypothetical protein
MQLQGYSSEPLSKIEYDMANSSGTLTNQRGTVTGQYYDPALHAFTTNFFACLDIDLAPGENTIILRGTDLAGNVTTGTLVYNLVSSTNVPVLALRWPQNGQTVCNGQITIDGWLDNFTARISAGIVDASGASNAFTGVVERNGHFWLEDLPLADGTNLVTLTASNVWAKVATTNFYVVKTGFVLTINPIAEDGQLFQPTIPVGGTVGDAGYTVWVNGRQASLEGNTWQVTAAPVNAGGSASFTVTAYPPGQNPTTDPENPDTNPANPGAPSDKLTVDKPMRRFIQNYHQQTTRTSHTYYSCPDGIGGIAAWADGWNTEASTCEWTDGPDGGGTESDSNSGSGTGCVGPNCWSGSDLCTSVSVWPGSTWPVFAEGVRTTDGTCDGTPTHTVTSASDPPVIQEHCAVSVGECYNWFTPWDGCSGSWSGQFERTADVNLLLYTGGKAVPKRQSLFSVSAKATEITEALDYSLFRSTGTEAIPPEDTSVGDFGKLGNDALAYATLAGDTTANISVKTSRKYYTSIATPRKLDLEVRSVSLLGIRTILRDNGEGPYGAPHWSTNETTGAVASYPVLYVSGDQVRASTQFKLTGDGGFPVIVKGTVSGGATAFTLWGTNDSPGGPTCGFDTYADIPLTTNLVDSFKPMAISWQYSAKDKLEFVDAGKSTNWVYVSLRQPSATLYHTVVHLACSVPGATSDGQAVDNTWNQFTGKGVNSWDGRPLHYYRSNSWMLTPTSLEGLLQARNGNCYAWGLLLYEAFGVNGILSTNVLVTATNSLYFLVKAWDFGAQAYQDEQVFKWQLTTRYNNSNQDPTMVPPPYATSGNLYGLMTSLSSIPGQHTQPPSEKFFVWHRILLWNGTYYDPSYGETYSGEANFESKAVEGFAMLDYHIQGNCSVWKVRKPNGTNSIVFTRQ